jgi:hypothetical protein
MEKSQKKMNPVVLTASDRAKILGKIPKPSRDGGGSCQCYTACTRCK